MKRFLFIVMLLVFLTPSSDVQADVSPPLFPPGSNPEPGAEVTQVRMVAETVLIDVKKDINPESLGSARVTADFTMRNLGTVDESIAVRFPIAANDGWGNYPEIGNLLIMVNGNQVQYRRASYPEIRYMDQDAPWAEFDVAFPVGRDVSIRVAYDLAGSGYYPGTAFYYILYSGEAWKGTIGSADIILRLPYEANPQNVIMNLQIGWAETTPGGVFQGNEVRWRFEDFEPGEKQSARVMEFALIAPSAWQAALTARANAEQNPNDGEGWGILARAYKQVFLLAKAYREDAGGQELYQLSVEAYEKCLSLKSDDAQWHAGFADLLARHSYWDWSTSGATPETIRALNEIHTALELAPDDPVVQEIALNMTYLIPYGMTQNGSNFDFPWLTQIPASPSPTLTVASAPDSTATPEPILTDTPQANLAPTTPTPVPQTASPICGSAAFLPLMVMLWLAWKRK